MSRILVVRGIDEEFSPLRRCLQEKHELYFVHDIETAMAVLRQLDLNIDLVVGNVYEEVDVFELISLVRGDVTLHSIPMLCLSGERSVRASIFDPTLKRAALLCGADKYLSMDSFCSFRAQASACSQCPFFDEGCDYNGLRETIEEMIALSQRKEELVNANRVVA
jgi:PleD family two-component response regulator